LIAQKIHDETDQGANGNKEEKIPPHNDTSLLGKTPPMAVKKSKEYAQPNQFWQLLNLEGVYGLPLTCKRSCLLLDSSFHKGKKVSFSESIPETLEHRA